MLRRFASSYAKTFQFVNIYYNVVIQGRLEMKYKRRKVKHKWMNFCLPDRKGLEKYFCSKNENVEILLHVIEYIVGLPNFVQVLFHGQLATQA